MSTPTTDILDEGLFGETLKRNNKQIKDDRMEELREEAEFPYRQAIEAKIYSYKNLLRSRNRGIDLNAENTTDISKPKNFDGKEFADADSALTAEMWKQKTLIDLDIARYYELFGKSKKFEI